MQLRVCVGTPGNWRQQPKFLQTMRSGGEREGELRMPSSSAKQHGAPKVVAGRSSCRQLTPQWPLPAIIHPPTCPRSSCRRIPFLVPLAPPSLSVFGAQQPPESPRRQQHPATCRCTDPRAMWIWESEFDAPTPPPLWLPLWFVLLTRISPGKRQTSPSISARRQASRRQLQSGNMFAAASCTRGITRTRIRSGRA
jgi:hypothetical protein